MHGVRPVYRHRLDELPSTILLLDLDTSLFIKRDSSSVNDGSGEHGRLDSGQTFTLVRRGGTLSSRDLSSGIDKLLQGSVTVTLLSVKVAVLVRRVLDVEGVVLHSTVSANASASFAVVTL